MKLRTNSYVTIVLASLATSFLASAHAEESAKPPKVGDTIKEYKFQANAKHALSLTALAEKGPLVLIVLRGYPGYQCPACTAQVADLRKHADEFKELGAN